MPFDDLIASGWRDYLAGRITYAQVMRPANLPTWICPQTNQRYQAAPQRIETVGNVRYAWVACRCCDSAMHAASDPAYDATSPQIHAYRLND